MVKLFGLLMRMSRRQLDDMVRGSGSPSSHFQVIRGWQHVCTRDLIYCKMPNHIYIHIFVLLFLGFKVIRFAIDGTLVYHVPIAIGTVSRHTPGLMLMVVARDSYLRRATVIMTVLTEPW